MIRSQDCGATAGDSILAAVRNVVAKVDISAYGANERQRTVHGKPFSLALATGQGARHLSAETSVVLPIFKGLRRIPTATRPTRIHPGLRLRE